MTLVIPSHSIDDGYYEDTGCPQVASRCQDCPLALCKTEDWAAYRRWKAEQCPPVFPEGIPLVMAPGLLEAEALRLGVCKRTVERRVARLRHLPL